jgi:competence protein ComFC
MKLVGSSPSVPSVGWVLDCHTISSTPTGDPYHRFDTIRTELGSLVYQLKYGSGGPNVLRYIVDTALDFVRRWNPPIDALVCAPPSQRRPRQPAIEIARELALQLRLPLCENAVVKVKVTQQMKNVAKSDRPRILSDAIQIGTETVRGRSILLFDDLFESGATLRRTCDVLLQDGGAKAIYPLVLTRTK